MPNAENLNCANCQGTGYADYAGFYMDTCQYCGGKGTIEQSSKVAGDAPSEGVGKTLDYLGADKGKFATVSNYLTVQMQGEPATNRYKLDRHD